MNTIDISGIDKAELLAALVNAARPLGMGFLHDDGKPMTKSDAQKWIDQEGSHDTRNFPGRRLYFDYVKGRPIKSDLSSDMLDPRLYDRDQGQGAAERVVQTLRKKEKSVSA